ncbi:MAG TPA: hypothetical protein VGK17_06870 [Propionicimonas sp.]|jgi:MinD-like ATPase involved in chromosome partitioning or flagellar assembly
MTTVALCSASGAPGVTTSALALTWVWPQVQPGRRVLLVDADPSGSGLLGGALQATLAPGAGVLELAALTGAPAAPDLLARSTALDREGLRMVLPGVSDPHQARTLAALWAGLADAAFDLHVAGTDVVIDAGRVGHRDEPTSLLSDADVVAVVLSPTVAHTVATSAALRRLTAARAPRSAPTVVVVGARRPYMAGEVERALHCPVEVVAFDNPTAQALNAGASPGARLDRSTLLRSVRGLGSNLLAGVPTWVL